MSKDPDSILIVTLSNIGDVVLTTPVIIALKERFPQARLTVVVGPKAKAVLEKSKDVHRIVVYDKKKDLIGKWKFLLDLWRDRYDLAVDLRNTAIPFLVLAPQRSPLFRHFKNINMRHRHLEVLEKTIGDISLLHQKRFQFFDQADQTACLRFLEANGIKQKNGWILMAPGAASERKRWPVESFRKVTLELSRIAGKCIFLIGSKEERVIAETVAKDMPACVKVFSGETFLSETAFLISKAALVVANDSAIMHLGFELGTPTVGIFGPTDHEKYGHEGPAFKVAREDGTRCGCGSGQLPYAERSCFHGLSPEKVTRLCEELLKGQGNRETD